MPEHRSLRVALSDMRIMPLADPHLDSSNGLQLPGHDSIRSNPMCHGSLWVGGHALAAGGTPVGTVVHNGRPALARYQR